MNRILYIFLFLSFSFSQKVIAVADILTDDLNDKQKKQLFNALESGLLDLGQYEVTSRQDVDKILDEQKFQKSGCTDQQCAAEIGKLLNADLMLLSEVTYESKSGEIDLYLKLVDVETAKISTSVIKSETIKKYRDILSKIPDYTLELYRKDNRDISKPSSSGSAKEELGTGTLKINSVPVGVKVLVDNKDEGLSPANISISEGKHRVVLTFKGHERFTRSVNIIADSTITVNAEMVKLTGDLMVMSTPKDADVYINDKWRGKTPLELQYLDIGDYFVRISTDGYLPYDTKYALQYNKENVLNKKLNPKPASVAFFSVPEGAEVFIDGKKKGITSIGALTLDIGAGKHTVSMKLKGYSKEDKDINLEPGEVTDMELVLSKLPQGTSENRNAGWVSIEGTPKNAAVVIRGNKLSAPLSYHELKKGNYKLHVEKDGYKSSTLAFNIQAQTLNKLQYELTQLDRKIAIKKSLLFPGLGHFYAEKSGRGRLFMALEGAALYSTYLMYQEFNTYSTDHKNANEAYLAATDDQDIKDQYDQMTDLLNKKNMSAIGLASTGTISGIIWIWNIVDAGKSVPTVFDISENTSLKLGLNVKGQLEVQIAF